MFWSSQYAIPHSIAIALSLGLLTAARLCPRVARALYVVLFAWACTINWQTALGRPQVYLEYADLAVLSSYRAFIRGWFATHVLEMVGTIATCQGLIASGLVFGGRLAQLALIGAIAFLVMIAPLGVGSGFPSTLLMAAGCAQLLSLAPALARNLPVALLEALREHNTRPAHEGSSHV